MVKFFKHSVLALFATASIYSMGVQAANYSVAPQLSDNPNNYTFTDLFVTDPSDTFLDQFQFTIAAPSVFGSNLSVFTELPDFNIVGLKYGITGPSGVVATGLLGNGSGYNTLLNQAGNYTVSVLGFTNSTEGGAYNATFHISAIPAAVPEPETFALMIAGLGLVGFAARRSKAI